MTRIEDLKFITGQSRYTDDIRVAGALHAYVLRSPHAHARIAGIDTAAAASMPGVRLVLTGAEQAADGIGALRCPVAVGKPDKSDYFDPPRLPLAVGHVRHVGDALALVVADSWAQARDAAEAIEVDYEPLDPIVDLEAAAAPGAPLVWDRAPGNTCVVVERGDAAATDAGFARAAHVVRLRVRNNRLIVNSLETRAAIGEYDADAGKYTLTTPSQGVHFIRKILAPDVLGVPPDKLRVLTPDVGGGFGMKFQAYAEQALVLWAAKRLGRPVRWSADRAESFLSDTHARAHVSEGELAVDAEGRFLAYRASTLCDMGAYASSYAPAIGSLGFMKVATGPYLMPVAHLTSRLLFTHTVPVDAYRGAGKPEAQYLLERLVDRAAAACGLDRAEIRRRNMLKPADLPWKNVAGVVYDCGDFVKPLDRALALADQSGFAARRAASEKNGKRRGFGIAAYVHGTGGDPSERGVVEIAADGAVTAKSGTQSQGQGHATAFATVVGAALGLPPAEIALIQGDSDALDRGGGTGGSSSLLLGASALAQASMALIEKGRPEAAKALEAAEADVIFDAGHYRVTGTDRRIGLREVAKAAGGLAADALFDASHLSFPNGVQVCEVEVDPETGRLSLENYVSVDDFGREITPRLVDGQVVGGIVQGVGQALMENAVYDESGQLLTGSFMDYGMPRADDLGPFTLDRVSIPTGNNPSGAKGVGECGTIGAPPCVVSGVCDALGVDHIDMPLSPEVVWRAARSGKNG